MTTIKGIIQSFNQSEDRYGICINSIWYNGWGKVDIEKGDEIEIEYEDVTKDGKTWHNAKKVLGIKAATHIEPKAEIQKTLNPEQFNELVNNNVALMVRCFEDAHKILQLHSDGGFVNPESLTRTAITLFLTLVKR